MYKMNVDVKALVSDKSELYIFENVLTINFGSFEVVLKILVLSKFAQLSPCLRDQQ